MKTCFKCRESKPLSEFYRHKKMTDGHLNKCKTCTKADVSANYWGNREEHIARERARYQRRKPRHGQANAAWRKRNPERIAAYNAVQYALRKGTLEKEPCKVCGALKVEAHHDDYARKLEVDWYCRPHHLELHGKVAW